jgi:hypothetical protein
MHFQERLEESIKSKSEVIKSDYLFKEDEKNNVIFLLSSNKLINLV